MALTREQILARKTAGKTESFMWEGEEVAIIRGLTRNEALTAREFGTVIEQDNYLISKGMVEPEMSVDDVAAWADQDTAGLLSAISSRIGEISRMSEGAGKSGVSRPRKRS